MSHRARSSFSRIARLLESYRDRFLEPIDHEEDQQAEGEVGQESKDEQEQGSQCARDETDLRVRNEEDQQSELRDQVGPTPWINFVSNNEESGPPVRSSNRPSRLLARHPSGKGGKAVLLPTLPSPAPSGEFNWG